MNYKCARAVKVERMNSNIVSKTYADYKRKGLTPEQWQDEMKHELDMLSQAAEVINVPEVIKVSDYSFDMKWCGNSMNALHIDEFLAVKNMERDLIHKKRIYHNDIKSENVLKKDGKIYLIDFGRATKDIRGYPGYSHLNLAEIDNDVIEQCDKLIRKITSSTRAHGGTLPYYGLDGKKGVRDWSSRFKILSDATDYNGKRILDLGCNQGLFITTVAQQFRPDFVMGVDASADIIEAANLYALKTNTESYFKQINLANGDKRNPHFDKTDNWQDELGS